ncbi:hypothetical protein [Streptomyces parvus]|uniref:hypothetical protein n=1 Tax=Streptomyces parvus TaxID=66428 RepID=UPI003D743858
MSGEKKTYEIETEGGKFYVQILAADRDARFHWEGDKRVEQETIKGRVQVATDAEFEGRVTHGSVKVRGRSYATWHAVEKLPEVQAARRGGDPWLSEPTYSGGFRNDRGQQVKLDAKAWNALYAMERGALNKFAEENPDWERESARLLFEGKRASALAEKRRLELAADQEDIEAAVWLKRIEDLGGE